MLPTCPSRDQVCLHPSCSPRQHGPSVLSRSHLLGGAPPCKQQRCFTPGALAPVRVILSRSIITYPAPPAPLAGTSRFHRIAAYTQCLRCAGAPRRPASGSGLSLPFLPDMPSPKTPESSTSPIPGKRCRHRPSPSSEWLGTLEIPAIRFTRGVRFRGFHGSHICYGLPGCSPPLHGSDQFPGRRELLLPGFQRVGRPSRCWI